MIIIDFLISIILFIFGILWSIVWWFLSFLFFPIVVLAIILAVILRYAYKSPYFRPYLDRKFRQLGERGLGSVKKLLHAITVMPLHVLLRFLGFSILHAIISLLWKPKWTPWQKAVSIPKRN